MQHISSKQALDELTADLVRESAGAGEDDLRAVGRELLGVAGLLRTQPVLRRVLSETTTDAAGRAALIGRVLSGKVGDVAVRYAQQAVGKPWASGADLREGIERLGRTAMFCSAERTGTLDEVEDQLFRFGRIVDGNPELSMVLDDPAAEPAKRVDLVQRLLAGKAHPVTVELLMGLASDTGGRSFSHGVAELVAQAADRKQELVATVHTAIEFDDGQRQRLSAALQRMYRRPVALHVEVDPELLGGITINVGDEVIDGSVAGRMAALRRRLAG